MSERYSKLFALSENLYSVGAPVVIAAGALQKDSQTGKVFAQLKIRNIQDKTIKAATVKITPFDTVGKPLGGTIDYQYLDLAAGRDIDFGQKTPVMLKEAATRSFAVSVSEVIFSDNSIWTAPNEVWEPLSPPVALETALSDNELAKQYRVKYGADCKCVFKKEKDLWRCACGAINHASEKNCHSCQREAASLAALNVDELKADRDHRVAAEQKATAEKKAAAAEQAKKTKKIVMITIPIAVVAIVAVVIISGNMQKSTAYNAAVALAEAGQYDEAVAAFTELGDYKDSREQIKLVMEAQEEARRLEAYNAAFKLMEARQYDEAIAAFAELGDYKDSMLKAEETKNLWSDELYNAALDYYLSDEPISLPNAWNLFNKCPSDYKDTQLYKDEIDDILKSLGGHYEKPEDNTKISVTLGNDDNGFRIDYEYHYVGSAFISGFNYVDTTIKWLIKDGQAVYGTAEDYPWKFTVTPSENSMTIEGDYEELNGTYTKTRDF